jgi:predicted nuclease of restriction endonuclease-like (RecB) superfamily
MNLENTKSSLASEIKQILEQARKKAYTAVNSAMVEAYWLIGKRIVEEEQKGKERANYGTSLIRRLSLQLTSDFGKGFSIANLKNFRQFYLTFSEFSKSYTLCSLLSWSHLRLLMRVDNTKARDYYIKEAAEQNWSTRQLERNIDTLYYERLLSSSNKKLILARENDFEKSSPTHFIKDPYVLEFLNLPENPLITEKEMETAIIDNLQKFLLELGKGFSFIGRQYRISTETTHFYIDMVFYNYILKCFVLIDLKTEKLTHQDIGQMDMYVRMFDDLKRGKKDNPTIGIILCSEKDNTAVTYSVLKNSEQLFASKYKFILPTEDELRAEIEREKKKIFELLKNPDTTNRF